MSSYTLPLFLFAIGLLACAPGVAAEGDDLLEYVKSIEPLTIRRSPLACPLPVVGSACPEENVFWYFKCCGQIADQCCFRLQDWVTVLLLFLAVCTILSIIINCVRCFCCA
ncbi:hypothetical protein CAEBREN_09209 [Caenorhabditis brenneri]|uniref:Uncharacterized protein n=1 Tax=Caenorhabditis brenneri TaxID=135651 RepID=G0P5C2_CAEBE|nr:hypothetical protein CAEBREN_09209 [Caenorhabditis brenneri]